MAVVKVEKKWLCFWQLILCIQFFVISTSAVCNVCQQNGVACINSTSFYLCFGDNTPHMDTLYHCPKGFECTDYNAICLQAHESRKPSCGSTSLCGHCSASENFNFACLSRTTFRMCNGASQPSGSIGYCPANSVCDATNRFICTNIASPHEITCDIVDEQTVSTTTTTPTTTNAPPSETSPQTPNEVCAQQIESGLYPTMPQDLYCRRFIHCYPINGIMIGTEYTCPSGTYYNLEMEQCTLYKPAYCL